MLKKSIIEQSKNTYLSGNTALRVSPFCKYPCDDITGTERK